MKVAFRVDASNKIGTGNFMRCLTLADALKQHDAKRRLTEDQEEQVQDMLIDKTPSQLKLPFALWTRDAVHLAIKKQFGVVLPLRYHQRLP